MSSKTARRTRREEDLIEMISRHDVGMKDLLGMEPTPLVIEYIEETEDSREELVEKYYRGVLQKNYGGHIARQITQALTKEGPNLSYHSNPWDFFKLQIFDIDYKIWLAIEQGDKDVIPRYVRQKEDLIKRMIPIFLNSTRAGDIAYRLIYPRYNASLGEHSITPDGKLVENTINPIISSDRDETKTEAYARLKSKEK